MRARTDFLANTELMVKQSVYSSVIAAQIAARHLAEYGSVRRDERCVVLRGLTPVANGSPLFRALGAAC